MGLSMKKPRAKRAVSVRKAVIRAPTRYVFSDRRNQFHNATPLARAKLLDGASRRDRVFR
jgi:hypothetical protein